MYEIIGYFWLCVSIMGSVAMLFISLEHPALLAITMASLYFMYKDVERY